jgi:hypothetical protein
MKTLLTSADVTFHRLDLALNRSVDLGIFVVSASLRELCQLSSLRVKLGNL